MKKCNNRINKRTNKIKLIEQDRSKKIILLEMRNILMR